MAIDGCKHSFDKLATRILPAYMKQMRKAISRSHEMAMFGVRGEGSRTILEKLREPCDFAGCYTLVNAGKPVYVGISRSIVQRLQNHVKGTSHNSATLAYRMARDEFAGDKSASKTMKNPSFLRLFAAKRERLKMNHVAFVRMDDPIEMCLFELYCAMKLDTWRWNTFRTH